MLNEKLCKIIQTASNMDNIIKKLRNNKKSGVLLSLFQYTSIKCVIYNIGDVELAQRILKAMHNIIYKPFQGTITLTFGDVAESHVGMQLIGDMASEGLNKNDFDHATKFFDVRLKDMI